MSEESLTTRVASISAAPNPVQPNRVPRAALVRLAVTCTALIFVACACILVYRGMTIEVPDAVLIVRGTPAWDGSVVSVDGNRLARPSQVTIDRGTKYTISFHLTPGEYALSVEKAGKTIFTQPVQLSKRVKSEVVFLPESLEGLTPTSQPSLPFGTQFPWRASDSAVPIEPAHEKTRD